VTGSTGAVTYSYSGTGATSYSASATRPTNAGTYQVIATLAADSNYNGAVSSPFAFTINKASLTITANNVNKTYGATLTGGSGSTAFTPSGLQNGQTIGTVTIAYGTGAAATAAVATYTGSVTPSAATGGTFTANNYDITYATGNIIVGKANLTITANDVNKTYGATLTGGAGSTAFTSSALQNSETIGSVTIAYGSGAASNAAVGTYSNTVTPSAATGGTFNTNNYNISYAAGDITVNPGAFAKLQILLPGETAAPGTGSGKTGTPTGQTTVSSFTVTVNAVDAFWNVVSSAPGNTIAIETTDGAAILPVNAALVSGTRTFSITLRTPGSWAITATNSTDGTKTANTSPLVTVTAGTKTSVQDGPWSTSATWSPAGEPYEYDLVNIANAHDITVTASDTCAAITFIGNTGSLSVNNGVTLTVTGAVTLNNDSNSSTACTITGSGTLNANSVLVGPPVAPDAFSFTQTTKFTSSISNFNITNNLAINSYGLILSINNATFELQSGIVSVNGVITTSNGISSNASTFSMASSGSQNRLLILTNASPFSLSGTGSSPMTFTGTNAVVEYLGSVPQTALGTTYKTLKINNSTTGVTLGGNATATTLDLTDGLLTTGSNVMTIASGGTILNASSTTYVNGKLARVLTNTNDFTYPVGKGGVYSPVVFTYAATPGTKTVTIEQFETGTPFSNSASLATFGSRYWNVTQSATGIAYRVGLNDGGNSGDVPSGASVVILRKDNITITSNATNYSAPNYTNVSAFAASNTSNDVSLGVNNIPLTITGITGINTKIYDGTAIATAIGTPILVGTILPGDTVTLGGTPVYTFDTKHIGTGKPVTVSGFTLGGTNGSGYSLPTNQIAGLSGDITVRPITVTAVSSTKVYDGNTNSSVTPSYALQPGDTAASIPTQSFDTKDFGTNKTLTPTGLVINDGNGGNNYTISYAAANLGTITQKSLTASLTSTVINKFYDGTTNATLTAANYSLSGVVSSEDVIITNTNGTYDNKNFGTGKTVTVTGLVLGGADAANYVLSNPTSINRNVGTISKTTLIASVIGTVSKQYDGNNSATLTSGNYTLSGLVPLEDVTITNTSGTYDNKRAGINKTVTVTGLVMTGADINNYNLFATATGAIGEITQKPITITGATSNDKIYDTTTEATVTGGSLVGVLGADDVLLIQEGTFSTILAGGPYAVTSTCRIAGDDALNYSLVQPILPNASINQKELTLKDVATTDKVYDATNVAILTGGELLGLYPVDGPNVSFIPSGYYADANIGNWTITSTTTLSGSASGNYYLTQPVFVVKKDITPLGLTVSGFTASNKPYDGNRDATVSVAGVSLVGVLGGQSVTLNSGSVTGAFDTKDIGTGKTVIASGFYISGPDASNYALTQPTTTANITTVALTITADALSGCAGTFVTTGRTEFTKSVNISGDITSVTLTPSPGNGSTPGDYTLTPSAAVGPGVGNYGPITYVAGTLHVNRTPTATIGGTATICLNEVQPLVTFTGANGEGTVHYRFYYTLNGGAELFRDSDPGVSTASFLVPTTTSRTDTYTLTRVLDLNTGCEQVQTGSAVMTIGLCTRVRPLQCGLTLPSLNTPIQASALPGATQYRFEVTRIDTNTVYPLITTSTYLFNPSTQISGGFLYGKSYSIRVQAFIGSWLAFGSACTVTAPNAPAVVPTKVRPFQCGATLLTVDSPIEANPVYLATQYQFEVTPQGGSAVVVTTPNYYFTLTGTAGLAAYSKSYTLRVNTLSGGNWTGFGDPCIVTTPAHPSTKLITAQCGATFNNLTFTLNSSNLPLVTKYRFRVVNGPTTRIAEVSRNYIIPSDLAGGYANNTVYTVDVATLYNGLWSAYGPACTVTTPFIRMAAQDINTNVFEVKAFPNPFARHFSLDIQSSSDDLVQVRVYDMIGRELEVQNATVSELSIKEIGTNYPSGVYNVIVSQGKEIKTVRMIKR
jgi:hypothetical protein